HFRWDGTTEAFAEHVVRNSSTGELLVNFDGVSGDLPLFGDTPGEDTYRVIAKGVPPYSGVVSSYTGEHYHARIDHFDGTVGRAVLGTADGDPTTWASVGSDVPPDFMRFSWFMPALLFIEHWDDSSKTGSLVAYNYDLD